MNKSKFPKGWNEERVRRVLAHHETQTEEETLAEDEAAYEDKTHTAKASEDNGRYQRLKICWRKGVKPGLLTMTGNPAMLSLMDTDRGDGSEEL